MVMTWKQIAGRQETPQRMQYRERENLKHLADGCMRSGDTVAASMMLILIAHWMRESDEMPFADYARQWIDDELAVGNGGLSPRVLATLEAVVGADRWLTQQQGSAPLRIKHARTERQLPVTYTQKLSVLCAIRLFRAIR